MKRIAALFAALAIAATLAGCSVTQANTSTDQSVDLSNTSLVATLCGDEATTALETVKAAAEAPATSGKRHALTQWGLSDEQVADDEFLKDLIATLETRASTPCGEFGDESEVGVEEADGTVTVLPWYEGNGQTVVIDTTTNPSTPPLVQPQLLDGSLKFTAQTLSWAGLVQRVGDQQWYIDGVNERAAQTGFDWDDVLKFAEAEKAEKVRALAIQIFNRPDLTDGQARDMVREYITPEIEEIIGLTVDELPIQRIDNGFVNTRNAGTLESPKMGTYFDTQHMVRVALMPIVFNEKNEPVGLDGSRGAGIFIDCGNLHWVPKSVWKCEDSSCTPPPPPPVDVCPRNPQLPPDHPDCPQPKGNGGPDNGWTPLGPGPLTDGNGSQNQKDSGETSGNVIDNQVPEGTESGDVTPDLPPGTVTAPGGNSGGDNQSGGAVDTGNTNQDAGGTNGDTCIPDPVVGITC